MQAHFIACELLVKRVVTFGMVLYHNRYRFGIPLSHRDYHNERQTSLIRKILIGTWYINWSTVAQLIVEHYTVDRRVASLILTTGESLCCYYEQK